ncbi:hypothetical protein MRB53_037318 [Persea americana]|nr:hypothetical protein MRB53_037318 [Persea americana]
MVAEVPSCHPPTLQNQLSAFKGDVSAASSKLSQKRSTTAQSHASSSRPTPIGSPSLANGKSEGKRRLSADLVEAPGPALMSTTSLMTQVVYAVEYLKSKDSAITFQDITNYLSLSRERNSALEHILKTHPKIEYDGKYRYRPLHGIRSAEMLERYLQKSTTAQGLQVKDLKDGWPGAVESIRGLEEQGSLLVTRNKKDNAPRMVFANDPSLIHPVAVEFQQMWHGMKLPQNAGDLRRELIDFGSRRRA